MLTQDWDSPDIKIETISNNSNPQERGEEFTNVWNWKTERKTKKETGATQQAEDDRAGFTS